MRIVFLGDSHLARVRRDLHLVGRDVSNAADDGLHLSGSAYKVILRAIAGAVGEAA